MKTLAERILDHPFFVDLPREYAGIITHGAGEESFEPGEILFREGEPANRLYLIDSGEVALEAHEPAGATIPIQMMEAGEVLGWSWLFPPFAWHFQARALAPTKTIVLDGAHLLVAAETDKVFGYELMKRLAQVLIHRLQALRREMVAARAHIPPRVGT